MHSHWLIVLPSETIRDLDFPSAIQKTQVIKNHRSNETWKSMSSKRIVYQQKWWHFTYCWLLKCKKITSQWLYAMLSVKFVRILYFVLWQFPFLLKIMLLLVKERKRERENEREREYLINNLITISYRDIQDTSSLNN